MVLRRPADEDCGGAPASSRVIGLAGETTSLGTALKGRDALHSEGPHVIPASHYTVVGEDRDDSCGSRCKGINPYVARSPARVSPGIGTIVSPSGLEPLGEASPCGIFLPKQGCRRWSEQVFVTALRRENFGVSTTATVLIGDEEFLVTPDQPFVFGRADRDGVVGLDASDMGISSIAGSVEWDWGLWWLVNHSRKRRLLLEDGSGGQPQRLECGQRFAVNVRRLTVLVPGAIYTHRIEVVVPESDLARVEGSRLTSGTMTTGDLTLSERDKDVLVAMFSGYLESFPHRSTRPRTYQQAAELLGPPWTSVTVRKQIERLKERAARADVYFEGQHANYDLADHLVASGLLVPGDLARLGKTP